MFILDDTDSGALDLPETYGVDDLPVIVQDKSFTDGGQLDTGEPLFSPVGFFGDTVVVNGAVAPYPRREHRARTAKAAQRLEARS